MTKLFASLVFCLLFAASCFATQITVSSFSFDSWTYGGSTATVRVYSNKTFVTSDSHTIVAGTASGFYKTINCTISGGTVSCPSVVLDSTTDSSLPTAKYIADLYDSTGKVRGRWMEGFSVPTSLGTTVTWVQLRTYNAAPATNLPVTYYTADQVNALIAGIAPAGSGVVSLSNTYSNSLSTAISSIGATPTVLLVDANTSCSTALTFPSTLYLAFSNKAEISKSTGCSITFQGVGLAVADSQIPAFSGFASGDVTWTGTTSTTRPSAISTELWDTGNTSLTDRLDRADKAFTSGWAKIVCYPRTVTAHVNLSQNREIYFTPGDYDSTNNDASFAFGINSHVHLNGTHSARIIEGATQWGNLLVGINSDRSAQYTDIVIENLTFYGNELSVHNGVSTSVGIFNATNSSIRNNVFYRLHAYAAYVGGFSDEGFHAENDFITGNQFIGVGTQAIGTINGRNIYITGNLFDQRQATGYGTYAVIDIEPNNPDDIVEGITVSDNYIDARDSTPGPFTIAPSDVNVANNTITIPSHGLTTERILQFTTTGTLPAPLVAGTFYYVRRIDDNTIQLADTYVANAPIVDLTTQGTGSQTGTVLTKSIVGIAFQALTDTGAKNSVISNNTIIGDTVDAGGGPLYAGIGATGQFVHILNNTILGSGGGGGIGLSYGNYSSIRGNHIVGASDVGGYYNEISVVASANTIIDNNVIQKHQLGTLAGILENEVTYAATSSGSAITQSHFYGGWSTGFIHPYQIGMTITYNGADYPIATVIDSDHITVTGTPGTVGSMTWTSGNVNAGADTITLTAHPYNTGSKVDLSTTGVLPAHTRPIPDPSAGGLRYFYYVIKVDANTIKVASTLANALANIPIDLTDTGSGTGTIMPTVVTKFSSNRFSNNSAADGHKLELTGTSEILSTADDRTITNVADADYSAIAPFYGVKAVGTIIYTSLTAGRTVNLPDAGFCRGKEITIKDGAGSAASHNITIDPLGSQTVDGSATKVINSNYGVVTIKSNGANWVTVSPAAGSSLTGVTSDAQGQVTVASTGSFPSMLTLKDDGTAQATFQSMEPGLQITANGPFAFSDGFVTWGRFNSTTRVFGFYKGADVASAASIVPTGNTFHVTGTTNITSIDGSNVPAGAEITIIFDGALTFTDGSNLKLAGNFVTTADDTITLKWDGTNWYEKGRSVN